MKIMYRFLILLSILHCIVVSCEATEIDKQDSSLSVSSKSIDGGHLDADEEKGEKSTEETTSSSIEATKRTLINSSTTFFPSSAIKSRSVRNKGRNYHVTTNDGTAITSISYETGRRDKILPKKKKKKTTSSSASILPEYSTKRLRKHRRRSRCKKRSGILHFDHGTKKKININKRRKDYIERRRTQRMKHRKSFQQHQSHTNRNVERQLFVGNRSLASFRQELAAAAAAKISDGTTNRKKFDNRFTDSARKYSIPKKLSKYNEKIYNGKLSKKMKKARGKIGEVFLKRQKEKVGTNSTTNFLKRLDKKKDLRDLSVVDHYDWSDVPEKFGKSDRSLENNFEKKIETDNAEKVNIEKTKPTNNDENFIHRTVLQLASILTLNDDRTIMHDNSDELRSRLFDLLKNSTIFDSNSEIEKNFEQGRNILSNNSDEMNNLLCLWLNDKKKWEREVLGPFVYLPACPCQYSNKILYDEKIWDERQGKYFRWIDVTAESEKFNIHKPGTTYCIRSLLAKGNSQVAQNCCFDAERRLLTHGLGAGIPNFLGSQMSSEINERIDILSRRLCKGNFLRFERVMVTPNNDNGCKTNPEQKRHQQQIENTIYYR